MSELATIRIDRGPNTVSRENGQRKIVVQANVADRDLGGAVADIQRIISSGVRLPEGYHVEYGGQFEAQRESSRVLASVSLVVAALIFLLLYSEFRSVRIAGLAMANLPLALIGEWPPSSSPLGSSQWRPWSDSSPCSASRPGTVFCCCPTTASSGGSASPFEKRSSAALRNGWPRS